MKELGNPDEPFLPERHIHHYKPVSYTHLVDITVLAAGSMFLGEVHEPIKGTKNPQKMEPAASTVISTIPKTFTLSIRVSIRAQKPSPRFSGKTEVLVFVIDVYKRPAPIWSIPL